MELRPKARLSSFKFVTTLLPVRGARFAGANGVIFGFDEFELDAERLELRRAGAPVKADSMVLRVLAALVRKSGQLVTRQELVAVVWNDLVLSDNVVSVAIARLRKTLGHETGKREFVSTLHNRGYRFMRPVIVSAAPLQPLWGASASEVPPPLFVGRERALDVLREALDQARAGNGRVCVLMGEPGIGKTRLAEQLDSEAAALGCAVAWGFCREAGSTPPLWPFAQLVRELVGKTKVDVHEPRLAALVAQLMHIFPELGDASMAASPDAAIDASVGVPTKHWVFDTILRLLVRFAEQRPCILILDDVHRSDASSSELLRYFADEIARTPILLVLTMRRLERQTASNLSYVLGHRNCVRIELERLSELDVARYVSATLDDPDGALGRAVFTKSEGNPFFMTELARQMRGRNPLDPVNLTFPDAALEIVRQRVLHLDDAARGVLSCAAVIGRNFELSTLQAVTERNIASLMTSLDEALAGELVVVQPSSRTAFRFRHELLRSVLYDAIPRVQQRRWHLRVAQTLEQRRAVEDVVTADLAYHFHAALPDTDLRKTVAYCRRAAAAASRAYAYADGVSHLRNALQALDLIENPSRRLRLDLMLWQALLERTCSSAEFEPLIRRVIRLASELRAGATLARAAFLLDLHPGFPPLTGAREALEEALELLPEDDHAMRGAVLARLAITAPIAFDAARSTEQLGRALALAYESGDTLAITAARVAQLHVTGGPARAHSSAEAVRAIAELCRKDPAALAMQPITLEVHAAIIALQAGDVPAVRVALERGVERCRLLTSRELLWHLERFGALLSIETGDHAHGSEALDRLHRRAEQENVVGSHVLCAFDMCVVPGLPGLGSDSALRDVLAADGGDAPSIWSLKVRALAAAGLHDDALAALRLVTPAALARLPCDRDYLGTLGTLARAAITLNARDYAEALYELLAPYPDQFAAHASFICEGSIAELLGLLAGRLGRRGLAIKQLKVGAANSQRAGLLVCAARAQSELANLAAKA
jgi:DNA-binding winged helix-turn-helix (wHTH) protein